MPRLRLTPTRAPLALCTLLTLVVLRCSVDQRRLHADATGGCDAESTADCRAASDTGGSSSASGGSGSGASPGAGGSNSEAGQSTAAGSTGVDPAQGTTGAPCANDPDCRAADGGPGRCLADWPGGYCSSRCLEFPDCAGNDSTLCRNVEGEDRCLVACFGQGDCRTGYLCDPELFGCVPE